MLHAVEPGCGVSDRLLGSTQVPDETADPVRYREAGMARGELSLLQTGERYSAQACARWAGRAVCLTVLAAAVLGCVLPRVAAAGVLGFSSTPSRTEPYAACGRATPGHAGCLAILVPSASAQPLSGVPRAAGPAPATPSYSGSGVGGGYAPSDLRSAYNLPSASAGSGQTLAIVDAFDDPNAESDLAVYRSRYGISACTTGNGCFRKVNQSGGATYPSPNAGWAVEISLDLDMASAACPNCHILLVEASSSADGNLFAAEDEAVALGATEISNSWAGEEFSGETSEDSHFHHPGVLITASAGDYGYEVVYPAASQYVIAVGGTSLSRASNSRGWSETAWSGTGSGCSAYEPKPAWQMDSGCPRRTVTDVAAVASPETPVSVADSYKLPSEFSKPEPGWTLVGGTSVSSPLIAGTMALANAYTRSFGGAAALYKEATQNGTGVLDDVVSGSNGACGSYLCNAGPGYDGPTGLGSPYGAPVVLANPPTVVTGSASALTPTSASLNATVNPNGSEVSECKLEYGISTSYGSSATCTPSPGSGSSPAAVSASLTGLGANTTYHFRISATNAGGTSKGSDQAFTTPPAQHWYRNEAPTAEGVSVPTISWGTLTLSSPEGTMTCRTAAVGYIENPVGGGPGVGASETFATAGCVAPGCPALIEVKPEKVPWLSELVEIAGAIRERSTGIAVRVRCFVPATGKAPEKDLSNALDSGEWTPSILSGTSATKPSFVEFGPGSGELLSEIGQAKPAGKINLEGFEQQEVITPRQASL
jgi:hypothetical protein